MLDGIMKGGNFITEAINAKSKKGIRVTQLEELKSGILPGIYVTERRNSSFTVAERWEFESKEESEEKYQELLDSGTPPVFLDCYVKFTLNQSTQKSCERSEFKVCGVQFPLEELRVLGCWHDFNDPLKIYLVNKRGETIRLGYGTDH